MSSISRDTLEKSRLFLTQAQEGAALEDRLKVAANLEAAIVMGRSITFHLQKEYSHNPDFKQWYGRHQTEMQNDHLLDYFNERRTYIVHKGAISIGRHISLSASAHVFFSGQAEIKVIRGKPWYRRSPKIIWEDIRRTLIRPIRKSINQWHQRQELARKRADALKQSRTVVTDDDYYFNHTIWGKRPAFELVSEYLDKLELIVVDAETHFDNT